MPNCDLQSVRLLTKISISFTQGHIQGVCFTFMTVSPQH